MQRRQTIRRCSARKPGFPPIAGDRSRKSREKIANENSGSLIFVKQLERRLKLMMLKSEIVNHVS
jgi:hypothetical protein